MDLVTLKSHDTTLLAINTQRRLGALCDVIIAVGSGQVSAHKAVLAACSPYFHTMFTGGFRESDWSVTEVDMTEVFPDVVTAESVIESMYTGKLDINQANVCTLYGVCSFILYDDPVQFCEDFMLRHLDLDTCMEYWQTTHHNPSGMIHSLVTELLTNRFHDHFIYRERLLDVSEITMSNLLKAEITRFCLPEQTLNLIINWFIHSEMTKTEILQRLLTAAGIAGKRDMEYMLSDIDQRLSLNEISVRSIQEVCACLKDTIRAKNEVGVVDDGLYTPTDSWTPDSQISSGRPSEKRNVVLAIAPNFTTLNATTTSDNRSNCRQLRLCAYVPQSQLWVDLGSTDYPKQQTNGEAISVSQSHLYSAGGNVYLLSDTEPEVHFLSLTSCLWKRVTLPTRDYNVDRQVFLLPLESNMFSVIIDHVIQTDSHSQNGEVVHTLILGKITDGGVCEEILRYEEDEDTRLSNHLYGPCWVEHSRVLVHCSPRDSRGHSENIGNILILNPETADVSFSSYRVDEEKPSLRSTLGKRPTLLEHGGWIYGLNPPSKYDPVSVVLRFRMSDDQSDILIEGPGGCLLSFDQALVDRNNADQIRPELELEKPSNRVFASSGSSLWNITSVGHCSLHQLTAENWNSIKEHVPPPCNVVLGATVVSVHDKFLWELPQAQYR